LRIYKCPKDAVVTRRFFGERRMDGVVVKATTEEPQEETNYERILVSITGKDRPGEFITILCKWQIHKPNPRETANKFQSKL